MTEPIDINEETPAALIGFYCYRFFGISESKQAASSIVAIMNQMTPDHPITITERFIYEETCFIAILIVEAEYRYNFIQTIIDWGLEKGFLKRSPDLTEVCSTIYSMVYWASGLSMSSAGLSQKLKTKEIERLLSQRLPTYAQLMWDNIQCVDPLPNRSFGSISNIREHPNEIFLGSVADNICDALSLQEDLLRSVQIQQAVSLKRILHMQDISSGEYIELLKNT